MVPPGLPVRKPTRGLGREPPIGPRITDGTVRPVHALACLVSLIGQLAGCSPKEMPDVILLTRDTTRRDHLGAYGYEREVSPVIDAFAEESVRYARAWSTSPRTLPAHASIITGKHPTSHGAHFNAATGNASLAPPRERHAD